MTDKPDKPEEFTPPEDHNPESEAAQGASPEGESTGGTAHDSASAFEDASDPAGEVTQDDIDALFSASEAAPGSVPSGSANDDSGDAPASFEPGELDQSSFTGVDPHRVTMLSDVKLRVKIQLGRTRMLVEDVLKLGNGSVVELDRLAGDPVDVLVNDRLIARGEVLVLNDNFCVRISEVLTHDPHRIME